MKFNLTFFRVRWLLEDTSFNFIPIVVISEIIFLFTLLNFLQTAFTDPGVLQKGETDNLNYELFQLIATIAGPVYVIYKYYKTM